MKIIKTIPLVALQAILLTADTHAGLEISFSAPSPTDSIITVTGSGSANSKGGSAFQNVAGLINIDLLDNLAISNLTFPLFNVTGLMQSPIAASTASVTDIILSDNGPGLVDAFTLVMSNPLNVPPTNDTVLFNFSGQFDLALLFPGATFSDFKLNSYQTNSKLGLLKLFQSEDISALSTDENFSAVPEPRTHAIVAIFILASCLVFRKRRNRERFDERPHGHKS